MWRTWNSLSFFLLTVSSLAAGDKNPVDPVWREKSHTAGKLAHDKYVALSGRVEETYETQTDPLPGTPAGQSVTRVQKSKTKVVRAAGNTSVENMRWIDNLSKPLIQLQCENHAYSFMLSRKSEGAEYALASYKIGQQNLLAESSAGILSEAFEPFGSALAAIEGQNGTTLKAIHWDERRALLHIVSTKLIGNEDVSPQELWVDPMSNWRVMEYRRETKSASFATHIIYGDTVLDSMTVPSGYQCISKFKGKNEAMNNVMTGRVLSIQLTKKTDRDFRLSAFGLPEPMDSIAEVARKTPRYVWFMIVAGALVGVSIAFRYLARRRVRRTLTETSNGTT